MRDAREFSKANDNVVRSSLLRSMKAKLTVSFSAVKVFSASAKSLLLFARDCRTISARIDLERGRHLKVLQE